MKKEKKVYSLVTKEVMNVITSLMLVVVIVLKLINPQNAIAQIAIKILAYAFLASYFGINLFRCFVKFDIVDEAAQEHYEKAKKKVFGFIWGFMCFASIVTLLIGVISDVQLLAIDISFTINAWWLVILYGAMQIAISALFIYFEKREA